MAIGVESIGFGFLAGLLSVLSPCVLSILPLIVGSAVAAHRLGLAALTAGLVLSFVAVGLFVGALGFAIGLDGDMLRTVSAVLLLVLGAVLVSEALQQRFATAVSGIGNVGHRMMARISPGELRSQFLIGLVLGAVWSPCVGPTLGAASVLAAEGKDLGSVAAVMGAFGVGAALPLLALGALSREVFVRWRGQLAGAARVGKYALGGSVLAVSLLILTGADRVVETMLVDASPAWLTGITTRF